MFTSSLRLRAKHDCVTSSAEARKHGIAGDCSGASAATVCALAASKCDVETELATLARRVTLAEFGREGTERCLKMLRCCSRLCGSPSSCLPRYTSHDSKRNPLVRQLHRSFLCKTVIGCLPQFSPSAAPQSDGLFDECAFVMRLCA